MEPWLVYALLSTFFAGIFSFLIKMVAERNYNSSLVSGYSYTISTIIAGIYFIYEGKPVTHLDIILILAFLNAGSYFLSILTRIESMKYIDSVIFFPLYKTFSPIFITLLSFFIFNEYLNFKEIIGIIFGICVPLLLITTNENTIQKNLKKGLKFLILTSFIIIIANASAKEIMVQKLNVSLFIFCTSFMGMIMSFFSYKFFNKNSKHNNNNIKYILVFGIIIGFFQYMTFATFQRALTGNLAIAFTINSFSILIPIILSIIFYKEHFSLRKGLVIILSILSILMFI